jgi:alkanesulfonate monooxygenase SsuD/methylene tetrahydromethanopterin reductase-like flavin-dependent oxidoreductase (luciferase family)
LVLPQFSGDVERVLAFARAAEDLGFDGVFAFDHLFPPGAPPERPALEVFSTLAAIAAVTERIGIGTLVARASLRAPGLLAKLAASLEDVSGGRLILAVGSGDTVSAPEHERFGLPVLDGADRGTHLAETVRCVRALLRGDRWPGGELVGPVEGPVLPAPTRSGGPPVWVGGVSDTAVRIAAADADAWNGWGLAGPAFERKVRLLRSSAERVGRRVDPTWAGAVVVGRDDEETSELVRERSRRHPSERDVRAGTPETLASWLEELRALGTSWAVLLAGGPPDRAELIATAVLPLLRSGS